MQLDSPNRSRCRFHLGYGNYAGIAAGDIARLEEAMDQVFDRYQYRRINEILDVCDRLWTNAREGFTDQVTKELISGDLNRSVIRSIDPRQARKEAKGRYMEEVAELAQQLWVPNYREDLTLRYRFERGGGDYVNLLPGLADTAVGAAQYEIARNGGGFGLPVF
jgi:hypothetical protein